eukprot:3898396-Amphidinium_carterae.1
MASLLRAAADHMMLVKPEEMSAQSQNLESMSKCMQDGCDQRETPIARIKHSLDLGSSSACVRLGVTVCNGPEENAVYRLCVPSLDQSFHSVRATLPYKGCVKGAQVDQDAVTFSVSIAM